MGGRGAGFRRAGLSGGTMKSEDQENKADYTEAIDWYVSGEGMWINRYASGDEGIGDLSAQEQRLLTEFELDALEPFLLAAGVRCRITQMHWSDNQRDLIIEADNPYRSLADEKSTEQALKALTAPEIARYKW